MMLLVLVLQLSLIVVSRSDPGKGFMRGSSPEKSANIEKDLTSWKTVKGKQIPPGLTKAKVGEMKQMLREIRNKIAKEHGLAPPSKEHAEIIVAFGDILLDFETLKDYYKQFTGRKFQSAIKKGTVRNKRQVMPALNCTTFNGSQMEGTTMTTKLNIQSAELCNAECGKVKKCGCFNFDDLYKECFLLSDCTGRYYTTSDPSKISGTCQRPRWPNNTVILFFDPNTSENAKTVVRQAVADIESRTCVRFNVVNTPPSTPHVYIQQKSGEGCFSTLGYQGHGGQPINLDPDPYQKCESFSTVQHELLHALGLAHEHSRIDRDKYVKINWNVFDQIKCTPGLDWEKTLYPLIPNEGEYDFKSIMHYDARACSNSSETPMIEALDSSKQDLIEQPSEKMTDLDAQVINSAYECNMK